MTILLVHLRISGIDIDVSIFTSADVEGGGGDQLKITEVRGMVAA